MKQSVFAFVVMAGVVLVGAGTSLAAREPAAVKAKTAASVRSAAEALSGTVSLVGADHNTVFLQTGDHASYSFEVNGSTAITIEGHKAAMTDLGGVAHKHATITFLAEGRKGDFAKSITVTN